MESLSKIALDISSANGGRWVRVYGEWELLIASASTAEYERVCDEIRGPFEDLLRMGAAPDAPKEDIERREALLDEIAKRCAARGLIKGSRGLDDASYGEHGRFCEAWILQVLMDPAFHPVWSLVRVASRREDLYRAKQIERAEKNLGPASTGRSVSGPMPS